MSTSANELQQAFNPTIKGAFGFFDKLPSTTSPEQKLPINQPENADRAEESWELDLEALKLLPESDLLLCQEDLEAEITEQNGILKQYEAARQRAMVTHLCNGIELSDMGYICQKSNLYEDDEVREKMKDSLSGMYHNQQILTEYDADIKRIRKIISEIEANLTAVKEQLQIQSFHPERLAADAGDSDLDTAHSDGEQGSRSSSPVAPHSSYFGSRSAPSSPVQSATHPLTNSAPTSPRLG